MIKEKQVSVLEIQGGTVLGEDSDDNLWVEKDGKRYRVQVNSVFAEDSD